MKKVGIIGTGEVGKALASGLTRHGYQVMLGSRDRLKAEELSRETGSRAGSFEDAASYGEIVILAVKGTAAEDVVRSLKNSLSGKTVIDVTNPIAERPPDKGVIHYFTSLEESLLERLQKAVPDANFVKSFNIIGNTFMIDPKFEIKPTMFICGNSDEAKRTVVSLLEKTGWEVADMGFAESARAIEPLCMLWCIPGFLENRWDHAFKLIRLSN